MHLSNDIYVTGVVWCFCLVLLFCSDEVLQCTVDDLVKALMLESYEWNVAILEGLPGAGKTTLGITTVRRLCAGSAGSPALMITIRGIVALLSGSRTYAYTFDPAGARAGMPRADALARAIHARFVWVDEAEEWSDEMLQVGVGWGHAGTKQKSVGSISALAWRPLLLLYCHRCTVCMWHSCSQC